MAWQPGQDFQTITLPEHVYRFRHAAHGQLVVTRDPKDAATTQINFTLQLTPPGGGPINSRCHLAVDNNDPHAYGPDGEEGTSSVGYGDIDISEMGGMGIIYLVHHVMAMTGLDLGVAMFVVENVVNDALHTTCQNCGMQAAVLQNGWQGACATVEQRSQESAQRHGWI